MRTSRVMPPAVAVAHDTTKTPNRSSRCLIPAAAPLRANTNVPASSSTMSVPAAYALNPANVCRSCSAPDVGITIIARAPGHRGRGQPCQHHFARYANAHLVAVPRNSSGIVAKISGPASGLGAGQDDDRDSGGRGATLEVSDRGPAVE